MDITDVFAIAAVFVGLPWVILHYVTRWKTAATITTDDEALLEELYNLAKRLDERMNTVERLVASEHPDFSPARIAQQHALDNSKLAELEDLIAMKKGEAR